MDGDRLSARDALRADQVTLANGLTRLRVASTVRGGGAPPEEGEFFVTTRVGGAHHASLCSQLSQFLPGRLGFLGVAREGGSLGERTILPLDHGSVGGSFQILNGSETRVDTPLTAGERGNSRQLGQRCFLAGATTWRQWGGWRCLLAGAMTSRRRGGGWCSLVSMTTGWRQGGRQSLLVGAMTSRQRGG
jgi:hypothetical protein